jgi:uncharacterized protein (DUF2236 family)
MRTADFVGTTTYGTAEAAEKAGARVRRIHRMLSATDPDTEERYPVDEPGLLLWVHCAEIDSYLHVLRRSGYPLSGAAADRYIGEHRVSARLVGLDPDSVPGDRAGLQAYFEKVRPELAAGAEARDVDDFLLRPPTHPLLVPARALLWRQVAQLAYASLPPYAHDLYGRPAPEPAAVTRRCVPPEPCCAAFPPGCGGNFRPGTSCGPWPDWVPRPVRLRTRSGRRRRDRGPARNDEAHRPRRLAGRGR